MLVYIFIVILGFYILLMYILAELSSILFTGFFTKAPYIPNERKHILKALELADISSEDIFCDLGSGDGRVLELAVKKFNVKKAIGYEIDPFQVFKTKLKIKLNHYSNRIVVARKNILEVDVSEVTLLYLYLYPSVLKKLQDKKLFSQLKKGTRIVSCRFAIPNMQPTKEERIDKDYTVFVYTIS